MLFLPNFYVFLMGSRHSLTLTVNVNILVTQLAHPLPPAASPLENPQNFNQLHPISVAHQNVPPFLSAPPPTSATSTATATCKKDKLLLLTKNLCLLTNPSFTPILKVCGMRNQCEAQFSSSHFLCYQTRYIGLAHKGEH